MELNNVQQCMVQTTETISLYRVHASVTEFDKRETFLLSVEKRKKRETFLEENPCPNPNPIPNSAETATMASLPWDIIVNILSRLSVKDLLRYRCVSKPLCSLIDGPDFIKMHLNHSMETNSHLSLIRADLELRSVDLDNLDSAVLLNPPVNEGLGKDIVGHCHGLLLVTNRDGDTAIWNPATRKHRKVPISDLKENPGKFEIGVVGFGYDPVNDDYKFLRMIHYYGRDISSFHSEVKVYSLKTNTWKRVADFPYNVMHCANGVLVGNSWHWMLGIQYQYSSAFEIVVAFDLVAESYRKIPLPDKKKNKGQSYLTTMRELGEWLCLVTHHKVGEMVDHVDIFVMKEYGVKESWTKLFSVAPSDVAGSFEFAMPLAYLRSVHQVLFDLSGDKLMVYDLKRKRVVSVKEISGPQCDLSLVYVRSLLGVGGSDENNSEKKAGENADKSKKQKQQPSRKKK
ncbi:F-box domain containing protein [Trema orientale]|uniref:F-box domain containing protein n=1 Tax=Trema orientale TaxID=63057 RepID=A0A2P5F0S3_TREOI|nr:F-box domain containing protein [Trema orientale]